MTQRLATHSQERKHCDENTLLAQQEQFVTVEEFEYLFFRFQQKIVSFIAGKVKNREQAYDLTQDTFTKAFRALQQGATIPRYAFSSWIYRIAANTTTDILRKKQLIAWIPLSVFTDDRGVGSGLSYEASGKGEAADGVMDMLTGSVFHYNGGRFENRIAEREIIQRILWKRMDKKHSLCLWLYLHDGLTCQEIADIMQISLNAVKMRLVRAKKTFVELYKIEAE